jgi:hypothetical protein
MEQDWKDAAGFRRLMPRVLLSNQPQILPEQTPRESPKAGAGIVLGFILLLHLVAGFIFVPPWEALRAEPLFFTDHPVHTHRVYVYREALWESGLPWGYDPAVGAGKIMTPGEDVGAKAQEVFGVILGFVAPGGIERLFLFITVLTAPLGTLLACRRLGFGTGTQASIMATMLPVMWRVVALYFSWGLLAFAAASLLASYVIVLFLDFSAEPGYKRYIVCVAAASVVFLLHALGPVVIAPSLVLLTLGKRDLPTRWRIA